MLKLQSYGNMDVSLIQQPSNPAAIVGLALGITMKKDLSEILPASSKQLEYLINAEHMSILEHLNYTFLIKGVSRSFLAQITRQRASSFTTGSQHYQDYSDYAFVVSPGLTQNSQVTEACHSALLSYTVLRQCGISKEEARQVLPNASEVQILWSINARNLAHFLRLRLCKRNVAEMQIFARKVLNLAQANFPDFFNHIGPQCFKGVCMQGKMHCGGEPWR